MQKSNKLIENYIVFLLLLSFDIIHIFLGITTLYLEILICSLGFMLFIANFIRIDKTIRKWIVAFYYLFFCSVFASFIASGQNPIFGLIGAIKIYKVSYGIIIFLLLKRYYINLYNVFKKIEIIVWIYYIAFLFFGITGLNFNSLDDSKTTLGSFDPALIIMISFYYITKFFIQKDLKYIILGLILITSTQIEDIQRTILLMYVFTIVLILLKFRKKKFTVSIIPLILFFIVFLIGVLIVTPSGREIFLKFSEAFKIFNPNQTSISDMSTLARLKESEYALTNFLLHPLFGNGLLIASEKERIIGDMHFFISDIGVIGILYAYGINGLFIFIAQIYFSIKLYLSSFNTNLIFWALIFFLCYLSLTSLVTGIILNVASRFAIIIVIINHVKKNKDRIYEIPR